MALVNYILFENWTAEQVAEWSLGLGDVLEQYSNCIKEHDLNGKKLMMLTHYDLEKIGITKLGHQELILEAVDLLKSLRYGYETENLQHLSLQLGCKARSLCNEIQPKSGENDPNRANNSSHVPRRLSITILAAVADLIITLKNMVSWLDRAPFGTIYDMGLLRNTVVKIGMDLISACQKDGSKADIEENIVKSCHVLADICEDLTTGNTESLIFQPASLELATIRKKPGEELGMTIQSAYYGVYVIGAIKDMTPADLCRKIDRGDEVIQVNHKTVVGWQLKTLVNCLKEKPKEVTLLLKKRPQHMQPFGQNNNRKKQMKNRPAHQVSTLPKSMKKRASREGEHAKQARPSLHELVNSIPRDDMYSPKEERTSDEKDDGNDTDNDVFRSGSESPQYTLPVVVDPKQRRATVSGGSPTLSRPLLGIDDLDTPTRPKSFTVGTADNPQTEYKNLLIPGEEGSSNLTGTPKSVNSAQQKRQDYKGVKPGPQSLEFVVKKPIPLVQEPDKPITFQDLKEQKKVLDLLEVPSPFPKYESTTDNHDEDEEEEEATLKDLCDNPPKDEEEVEDESKSEKVVIPFSGESKTDDDSVKMSKDTKQKQVHTGPKDLSAPDKSVVGTAADGKHHVGSDFEEKKSTLKQSPTKDLVNLEQSEVQVNAAASSTNTTSTTTSVELHDKARHELHASYVDHERKSSPAASSVAMHKTSKSEPKLMSIRKIESLTAADVAKKSKAVHVSFNKETVPESSVSYKTIVVGGVVQKIPIEAGSPIPSDSPVQMRKKKEKTTKKVNRRVSCKDLGEGDCEGFLYKRKQKQGILSSHWLKRWCVLKQYNLFFFKSKEDLKAEGVLHMPAFQVSPAHDVTKRKFAFKIHNAGTSFIFASESQQDMTKWMNKMGLAAISFSPPKVVKQFGSSKLAHGQRNDDYYSESDDDDVDGKESLHRSASSGSCTSLSSQTSTPEREINVHKQGQSVEDLTALMRSIESENLTLTGQNKQAQRRSTIRGSRGSRGNKGATGGEDVQLEEQADKVKKMNCLKRTLKAKEQELEDIEKALMGKIRGQSLKHLAKHLHEYDTSL